MAIRSVPLIPVTSDYANCFATLPYNTFSQITQAFAALGRSSDAATQPTQQPLEKSREDGC